MEFDLKYSDNFEKKRNLAPKKSKIKPETLLQKQCKEIKWNEKREEIYTKYINQA